MSSLKETAEAAGVTASESQRGVTAHRYAADNGSLDLKVREQIGGQVGDVVHGHRSGGGCAHSGNVHGDETGEV